ncbi:MULTISPECIES: sulfonate ABC transporter substrate-binding protein [unclassified Rhizobacter]|uniref:sulfonate ABC transporter substrate-binding protein n=1 Tax=unclassified Rhizobacter TaxID=2640088 RepID=UPI0006F3C7E9|nr:MULTISPECIES: sulfonate ABC transporter substrate-binding protein [unclassified Rhizobacter]KQU77981.1 sulfonate ABC transporter substrate-binding protein [Rhizobacter sp. Root29]KQW15727.1 sulfonate ABC transporter substrate-binding protein [Rhizobacter sp. Root1238]KRB24839.1 sulfonate ABC transporter substrate-binding protein [Rhizobacter sp. Root16D2]
MSLTRRDLLQASLGAAAVSLPRFARAAESAPAQLRIGFQKAAVNLVVLKQQAALEKRFAGSSVKWIEFPAGPQLLEALAVGSLEFGLTGDTPPVFAQAAGKDLRYVGAEPPKPLSSAILVKPDAPLKTLADLKGRKVALQKGSSAHYLLVRAVDRAGLQWSDIQPTYLAPSDARAAFERGSVDAWAIWDPYYAAVELDLKPRVLANGRDLSSNNSFYLASRALTEQHPQAVLALLAELTRADAWVQANRKEAAQLIADYSGLSLATVHLFISRRPVSPAAPLTPAIVADQQRVADAFARLGLIPQAVRVADIAWSPTSKSL